jgi:hypothetical protein
LGIGDWAQSPIPNPQSPIPNPHPQYISLYIFILKNINIFNKMKFNNFKKNRINKTINEI